MTTTYVIDIGRVTAREDVILIAVDGGWRLVGSTYVADDLLAAE
jgi:hypothetical protein